MDYLILALATWRIASLATFEDGPGDMFLHFRISAGTYGDEPGGFAKGLACLWCNSIWFGVAWTILYLLCDKVIWLALPFALSAGAILVDEIVGKLRNGES